MAIKTLEEVFEYLDGWFNNIFSDAEREDFKSCDVSEFHNSLGRELRNYLKLWSPNTALTRFFRDTYDIVHADDISGLILGAYQAKLLNKEFSIYFEAIKYRNYWRSLGLFEKMLQEFDTKKLVDYVP